jgi:hypothetical protein
MCHSITGERTNSEFYVGVGGSTAHISGSWEGGVHQMQGRCQFKTIFLQCYAELLEKFPGSASIRLDYANFCDVVGSYGYPTFTDTSTSFSWGVISSTVCQWIFHVQTDLLPGNQNHAHIFVKRGEKSYHDIRNDLRKSALISWHYNRDNSSLIICARIRGHRNLEWQPDFPQVLNDMAQAETHRNGAELLENGSNPIIW